MEDFWNDVRELAASPVSSQAEAQSVLDLFGDLIAQEIAGLDADACQRCCAAMVSSRAYQNDLHRSHEQLLTLLLTTDPLHKHEIEFVATVILNDSEFVQTLSASTDAVNTVINLIWMFRFTQPRIVEKYMLILVATCIAAQLDASVLSDTISSAFVLFLFRSVCNHDEALTRPSLLVLLALNHQYMLRDMHGPANKVFWELEQAPQQYTDLGSSLVMRLNRSRDSDEALKIITCKFLYLLFTTKQTADLLYTNDLHVLLGVVIRELNDLPTECVQTREMYLRVLYVMLVHSAIELSSPQVRSTIVQTLRQIMERVLDLDAKADQAEMMRLAERCLAVRWLKWHSAESSDEDSDTDSSPSISSPSLSRASLSRRSSIADDFDLALADLQPALSPSPSPPPAARSPPRSPVSPRAPMNASQSLSSHLASSSALPASLPRSHRPPPPPPVPPVPPTPPRSRMAPPPPPPPPPRHMSVESLNSEDSELSIDFVGQLRPPPAPPSRKFMRLEKVRSN